MSGRPLWCSARISRNLPSAARLVRLRPMSDLRVPTQRREQLIDITDQVQAAVSAGGVRDGLCHVCVPHTTCAVTVNEGADPDVQGDVLQHLAQIVPNQLPYWKHAEGNSDAHVKAILVGSSELIPIQGGRLRLGRWQSIFLCEFDGPRQRQVWVTAR